MGETEWITLADSQWIISGRYLTVTLTYQIKAKFPIKARTPLSKVYPYYNPERVAFSAPQDIVVEK